MSFPASQLPDQPLVIEAWQGVAQMRMTTYDPSRAVPDYAAIVAGKTVLFDAVEALIMASTSPIIISYFEYGASFTYGDTMISELAAQLGLSDDEVHDLFVAAAALSI